VARRYCHTEKAVVQPRLLRAYRDRAFEEADAAVPIHGTGRRRVLRAEQNLRGSIPEDRKNRSSRFFPSARARYWTLQSDIKEQETLIKYLPEGKQVLARQTLQQYEEVRNWLTRPHYLQGPKWDGGNGLSKEEMYHLHNLGWSDNDLTNDEATSLTKDCIDEGYATVKGVLDWILEDGDKLPAHGWNRRVEVPLCREPNCRCGYGLWL
jgi:hypothetical protein